MQTAKLDLVNLYKLPWSENDNPNGWIEVTTYCQLACPGCYRGLALPNPPRIHEKFSKLKKDIDTLIKIRKIKILSIAGGEPLLYPHLDELLKYAKSRGLNNRLVTNGAALSEKRLKELKKLGVCEITIHVAQYQNRGNFKNEKETNAIREYFCKIFRHVKSIELNFIITVSKNNFSQLANIIDYCQKNSDVVSRVFFTNYRDALFGKNEKEDTRNYASFNSLVNLVQSKYQAEPCAYLGKTLSKNLVSWLFFAPIMLGKETIGYADSQTVKKLYERSTQGEWDSFPAQSSPAQLIQSLSLLSKKTTLSILKGYTTTLFKNPINLRHTPKVQLVILLNTPRKINAGYDLCDGCPDAILFNHELVPSCLLEKIKSGEQIRFQKSN